MVFNDKEYKSFDQFLKEWDKTCVDRTYKPPFNDSSIAGGNRIQSLINDVSHTAGKRVLFVTHGGIIGDFLRNIFLDSVLPIQTDQTSSVKYVSITECSITEVEKNNGSYTLKRINDTSHLSLPIT